jgi:hypothetical protein
MNGIDLNIIAYISMAIVMYMVSDKYTKENIKNISVKLKLSGSLLLMIWAIFMSGYLIVDYSEIIKAPLNIRLNFFETVTNFLIPYFILVNSFSAEIIKFLFKK